MTPIADLLGRLTIRHSTALRWFLERANSITPWPEALPDGTLLVTKAKGIYKPEWSEYALSIREVLKGPYPDKEPTRRPDGTWIYRYFQEGRDPVDRDDYYTNRALMACQRSRVPVGVLRQIKGKPNVKYEVLGLGLVTDWSEGYFTLEGTSESGDLSE